MLGKQGQPAKTQQAGAVWPESVLSIPLAQKEKEQSWPELAFPREKAQPRNPRVPWALGLWPGGTMPE